jgi:hypothetical protein
VTARICGELCRCEPGGEQWTCTRLPAHYGRHENPFRGVSCLRGREDGIDPIAESMARLAAALRDES